MYIPDGIYYISKKLSQSNYTSIIKLPRGALEISRYICNRYEATDAEMIDRALTRFRNQDIAETVLKAVVFGEKAEDRKARDIEITEKQLEIYKRLFTLYLFEEYIEAAISSGKYDN